MLAFSVFWSVLVAVDTVFWLIRESVWEPSFVLNGKLWTKFATGRGPEDSHQPVITPKAMHTMKKSNLIMDVLCG